MRISSVQGAIVSTVHKTTGKMPKTRQTAKETARIKALALEHVKAKREAIKELNILPELNIFGLPKWM